MEEEEFDILDIKLIRAIKQLMGHITPVGNSVIPSDEYFIVADFLDKWESCFSKTL